MFPDRAAERLPMPRVLQRDRMTAPRRPEPARAVRPPPRPQPYLRVAKSLADLTQDAIRAHSNVVEFHFRVTARRIAIEGVQHTLDREPGRVHIHKEHRRSEVAAVRVFGPCHYYIDRGARRAGD